MNKTLRFALPILAVFLLLWACNKKIVLITNVEYMVTTEYTKTGFVQEPLPTQIVLTPEVLDYPGFEYFMKYELLSGEGYFVNASEERIADATELQLDATLDYTVNWNYVGTKPGPHRIKLYTRDNFEKEQVYDLVYEINPVAVTWTANTTITQSKVADTIPITLELINETADFTTDFSYSIQLAEGSGVFLNAADEVLETEALAPITEGQTAIRFIPDAAGTVRLEFVLNYYDEPQKTALLNLTVLEEAVNLPPVAVAAIQNNGVNKGEAPFTAIFDGSGSTDDGSITLYEWDFGDGSPVVNGETATHTFETIGEYNITLRVQDDEGVDNENTDTNTVRIFVEEIMQSDFMAVDDQFTVENNPDTILTVLDNDLVSDGTTAIINTSTQPNNGKVSILADGTISYTPDDGYAGRDSFSYTITNDKGVTSSAEVLLTVTIINQPPEAMDDNAITDENKPVTIPVLDNDNDPEDKPLRITNTTEPANGDLTVNTNGTITYTPDMGYTGDESFTYTINDGLDGNDATATVTITINDVNQPPVADDFEVGAEDDEDLLIDILENVNDPEDDPITIATISALNGIVEDNGDGTVTYTPVFGLGAVDQITYTVNDGNVGNDATARIKVTITKIDVIPIPTGRFEDSMISRGYDTLGESDGMMLRSDAESVIEMSIFESDVTDLSFLKYFTNIKDLDIGRSTTAGLNFKDLPKLEILSFFQTGLDPLDLKDAPKLKSLSLKQSGITKIDITSNSELTQINFDFGSLSLTEPLDLSNNKKLETLSVNSNIYPGIIFNNPNLKTVSIVSFTAKSFDLSKSIKLDKIAINGGNELVKLNVRNGNNGLINTLNVTGNENLSCIDVDNVDFANTKTASGEWIKDDTTNYNTNCN